MKTDSALRTRARAIAESHFYSDDECEVAWQPFEDYPDAWIREQVRDLEKTIYNALKWIKEK